MATIRRSGSCWQALIRKKEYVGPKAKTFRSKAQAQLWANAVEGSLKRPEQLDQPPPQILKEAIDLFIEGPLQEHEVVISSNIHFCLFLKWNLIPPI